MINQKLSTKNLILGIIGVLLIGGTAVGGYWYLNREKSEENGNGQNQTQENTQKHSIQDLGNGWKLYTNETWKYSIEFPKEWTFIEPERQFDLTEFNTFDSKYYDPSDYYPPSLTVGAAPYKLEDKDGVQILSQTVEANKEYYEKIIKSHDPSDVIVGNLKAKKAFIESEGMSFTYYIPNEDFSTLYVIATSYKESVEVTEYQHMLDSFKILK